MRYLPALLAPAVLAALAYAFNLPQSLGAHPWWSQTVTVIGLIPGLALAAILNRIGLSRVTAVAGTGAAMLAAGVIARTGQTRFAASYAEDTLAGQMWYFGWIATCGLAAALVAAALWPARANH